MHYLTIVFFVSLQTLHCLLISENLPQSLNFMHGIVIKNTGSSYLVRTDEGQLIESRVKGNFRLKGIRTTNPVAVGDGVTLRNNGEGELAFITAIDPRRNYIIRKASNLSKQSHILAANIDQALLVATLARPETSTTFIDRFLASAEAYRVPVVLVLNKMDDLTDDERATADYKDFICAQVLGESLEVRADVSSEVTFDVEDAAVKLQITKA